jgi:hypothetical protein
LTGTWEISLVSGPLCPGRFRKANGRTLDMYAGEKSDWAIVPKKRANKGRQLPAEFVEGRARPKGNSRQTAAVRTQSRGTASIWLAAVRRAKSASNRSSFDVRPEGGARCVSSARRDLRGGRGAISVPTATLRAMRLAFV